MQVFAGENADHAIATGPWGKVRLPIKGRTNHRDGEHREKTHQFEDRIKAQGEHVTVTQDILLVRVAYSGAVGRLDAGAGTRDSFALAQRIARAREPEAGSPALGPDKGVTMRWLLLSLALIVAGAQSQEAGHDKSVTKKDEGAERKKESANRLPANAQTNKSKPVKATSKKTAEHPDEKLQIDRQIADYTRQLAAYTDDLSRYTFWLVIATIVLGAIGVGQGWFLKGTVDLARGEFNAVHRPKIRIRYVWPEGELWGDGKIAIRAQIINVGISRAKIIEYSARPLILAKEKPLPPIPDYQYKVKVVTDPLLESGNSTNLPPNADQDIPGLKIRLIQAINHEDHSAIRSGEKRLYFLGYVRYEDAGGRPITTAFCRVLEPPTGAGSSAEVGRFVRLTPENPDYEYED